MLDRRRSLLLACLLLTLAASAYGDGKTQVSITARDRNIRAVIADLATAAHVEVKIRPEVNGLVTANIAKLPFEEALTVVCAARDYGWRLSDGVYHVGRFSTDDAGTKPTTLRIPLPGADVRRLARAFGYLDLQSLDQTTSVLDLHNLLPPGLDGPPKPYEGGLEVRGTATATADFQYLVTQLLQDNAVIRSRVLVAEVMPDQIEKLPVYWAQGVMRHGESPGREVEYNGGNLDRLEKLLRNGGEGIKLLAEGNLTQASLSTAALTIEGEQRQIDLRMALRTEAGLGLSVFLKATISGGDGEPVELLLDGAPLPPEEGCVILSKAPGGAMEPAVLLLVQPVLELLELP